MHWAENVRHLSTWKRRRVCDGKNRGEEEAKLRMDAGIKPTNAVVALRVSRRDDGISLRCPRPAAHAAGYTALFIERRRWPTEHTEHTENRVSISLPCFPSVPW